MRDMMHGDILELLRWVKIWGQLFVGHIYYRVYIYFKVYTFNSF